MKNALISSVLASLLACLPVAADSESRAQDQNVSPKNLSEPAKDMTVPLQYVTDRNISGETYGHQRRYKVACRHEMYYGTTNVTVPNSSKLQETSLFEKLDWKPTSKSGKKIAPKDRISKEDGEGAKAQFFERLKTVLDQDKTDTVCVYVHGAADSFEDASQDAALMEYYMKRPLILYSWPAESKMLGYIVDNNNSEWSQEHFQMFCADLVHFRETHPLRVIFIAHSMGNRFLFRALQQIHRDKLASDFELISPDMDFDTCIHYLHGFGKNDRDAAIRLYVSNHDKMLRLSQKLFGGYARLGEDVNEGMGKARGMEEMIVEREKSSKDAQKANVTVVADKSAELRESKDSLDFERIDFTSVDKGWTGHSIPFQLVADMVNKTHEDKVLIEKKVPAQIPPVEK